MKKKVVLTDSDVTQISLSFSKEEDLSFLEGLTIEVMKDDALFVEGEEPLVKKFLSLLRKNKINFEEDTFPLQAFNP